MTAPIIAFFSNRGGIGTTSLVYHLAWMYAELGWTVVAADLDPQAHLTASFLGDARLEEAQGSGPERRTISDALGPLVHGEGDLEPLLAWTQSPQLHLIAGSLELSSHEDAFSSAWMDCLQGAERALRITTAFWRGLRRVSDELSADLVLVDLGPHLGAVTRAGLLACDHVVVPAAPDPASLQSLRNLGTVLARWRADWAARVVAASPEMRPLPAGAMRPAGYVVLQHGLRMGMPLAPHPRFMDELPAAYAKAILGRVAAAPYPGSDPSCLGVVRRYTSLMALSQEARRPIFGLRASDGALGAAAKAALDARRDFEVLARRIADACELRSDGAPSAEDAQLPAR